MKKKVLGILAMSLMMLTSCDGFEGLLDQLDGNASITINNNDPVNFSSSLANLVVAEDTTGTLFVAANLDITKIDSLTYPYVGMNLTGCAVGSYTLDAIPIHIFNQEGFTVEMVLNEMSDMNTILYMDSDSSWYLSNSGTVNVSEYGELGFSVKASFADVQMLHLSNAGIDAMKADLDSLSAVFVQNYVAEHGCLPSEVPEDYLDGMLDESLLINYFEPVTVSGNFTSLRTELRLGNLLRSFNK
ncbi:MAG: hypothetical protein HUK17_00500 [Bacteroidales bacterium]|nr:hypothetical protein [Bacteroidales bacterium]